MSARQIVSYAEPFHDFLLHSLEKADVLRIVRALAIFRPSLIALQMPLTEEDEVFVERCIQRTILVSLAIHCTRNRSLTLLCSAGIWQASIFLWHTDSSLEADLRNGGRGGRI